MDLTPPERELVIAILRRHIPHRPVAVFGSRARGGAKPYSDLDLLVLGDEPLPFGTLASLADDFTESDLRFKVDVAEWATISDSFRKAIGKDLKPLLP